MTSLPLRGVVVPTITPVTAADEVDEPAFRRHLRRLLEAGVHAIFVGGSAGEGPLLVDSQWRRMTEIARDEVGQRAALLGGVMDSSTRRVRERITWLGQLGYRYFVLTPTYYLSIKTPSEHLRLFGDAREAAGEMEMIAYNIPSCTASTLAVDTMLELGRRGWIRCCKESSGDWTYLSQLLQRAPEVGLRVLAGDERTSGAALLAGAVGIVPVCANYDPATYLRLYEAGSRGDRAAVEQVLTRVLLLQQKLPGSGVCWVSGIKYALAALGYGTGKPVSPLEEAEPERKARIDALLEADRQR